MSIWNKVLVGLIGVTSLVFFYMATRTLKTHAYWRELAQKHEAKIGQIQDENIRLVEGVYKEGEPAQSAPPMLQRCPDLLLAPPGGGHRPHAAHHDLGAGHGYWCWRT